jgi:hypothetical protein
MQEETKAEENNELKEPAGCSAVVQPSTGALESNGEPTKLEDSWRRPRSDQECGYRAKQGEER